MRMTGCLLLLLALPAAGQEPPPSPTAVPGFELERVSWIGSVAAGRSVTVINRFGDVRARFGGYEGQVEVFANVQHFAAEGPRLAVEARESQAGVEVTVGYRSSATGELITERDPEQKKRADLAIFVPMGAPLSATTDQGLIEVRGLKSDVSARTVSGDVAARETLGELRFDTVSGDVLALLEDWGTERHHAFASDHGDLSLNFGGEVDAAVHVATSGLISTDFSIRVDYQAERRPIKRGEALIGKGSSTVEVQGGDGHVRLVSKPLARRARMRPERRR